MFRRKLRINYFILCDDIGIDKQVFAFEHFILDMAKMFFEQQVLTAFPSGFTISPALKKLFRRGHGASIRVKLKDVSKKIKNAVESLFRTEMLDISTSKRNSKKFCNMVKKFKDRLTDIPERNSNNFDFDELE